MMPFIEQKNPKTLHNFRITSAYIKNPNIFLVFQDFI